MRHSLSLACLTLCAACAASHTQQEAASAPRARAQQDVAIPFQKFTLDNGLNVIVHEDHSDPVVAVYIYYHVGSAREERGRSGFAHLFEHMLFQGSQHVGDDQHFKLVQEAGGTLNGSTTSDRTNYFEVLPANQVELALWLEADRMGFLLPAMTQAKLDNQRDVVKNERRQNYENRPYGQSESAIAEALYPPDHPYSWITIGTQEDLTAASLEDVKAFFARWYGPNNATLAIGGDVTLAEAKRLAERYFGSLPRGSEVEKPAPRPTYLAASKRIVLEDRVKLPQLMLNWPSVESYHADQPALDLLASLLAANKSAILDKALMIDEELAREANASNESDELAGKFTITLRANPKVTLDTLESKTRALLEKLARDGVDPDALQRVKNVYEARFVRRFETVGSRTNALANYNTFLGDPGRYQEELRRHLAVTAEDVVRVLKEYVLHRPCVVLSIVPQGKQEMAASEPSATVTKMETPHEKRSVAKQPAAPAMAKKSAAPAPADLDRTKKPGPGAPIAFRSPVVWHDKLDDGVAIVGTPWKELPMTTLSLAVPAGRSYEKLPSLGIASITAEMMNEGTRSLSTTQLTEALDRLGATMSVSAGDDEITITLSCLDKHLDEAVHVLGEVLLHPRFADEDFKRIQKKRLVAIETRGDQIRVIAEDVYRRLLWGDGTVSGAPSLGTKESVSSLTVEDVKAWWRDHVVPAGARLTLVGALDGAGVKKLFTGISSEWKSNATTAAAMKTHEAAPPKLDKTRIYLVDKPGAAQSEIRIGHVSVASTDPDFYPLSVLNYALGGGFSSRVNMNLREKHGYTYGARTSFEGGLEPGAFTASGGVKTDDTKESVVEFMNELTAIHDGIRADELAFTKDSLRQGATRQFEATMALSGYLENIGKYGFPDDYASRRLKQLAAMRVEEVKALSQKHLHAGAMAILVVGDKAKVAEGLNTLGYGDVIELDIDGRPMGGHAAGGGSAR